MTMTLIRHSLPLVALIGSVALGAEEAAEGPGEVMSFPLDAALLQLIIFIAVIALLGKFVWPKVLHALDARQNKIRGDIAAAEKANQQAQATLEEYRQKLAEAHAEARSLIDQARVDADAVRSRLVADAESEVSRIKQRATEEIGQARNAAVQEVYAAAAQLATAVAGKILQRQIDDADTQSLVDQSLSELEDLGKTG